MEMAEQLVVLVSWWSALLKGSAAHLNRREQGAAAGFWSRWAGTMVWSPEKELREVGRREGWCSWWEVQLELKLRMMVIRVEGNDRLHRGEGRSLRKRNNGLRRKTQKWYHLTNKRNYFFFLKFLLHTNCKYPYVNLYIYILYLNIQ